MSSRVDMSRKRNLAGYLLGFALGGFYDGILLHQILQWHHLLSLVPGAGDMSRQVLFDGLFHALMYVIAAAGLVLLWKARRDLAGAGVGRLLIANVLIGFGSWHMLDGLVSHWMLGIHRIKIDSDSPLFWDLLWFFIFGVLPAALGWIVRRGAGPRTGDGAGRGVALGLALAVSVAAPWAAKPPAEADSAVAVFRPSMTEGEIMNAVVASGGAVLWHSRGVWAIQWNGDGQLMNLYSRGAMIVSNSLIGMGCLAWAKV